MNVISQPCLFMSGINFFVGFYHLFMFIQRKKALENLPFATLCISVGLYNIFCIGLYNSNSLDHGIIWQRLQLNTVTFISISIVWFVSVLTNQKKNKIIIIFTIIFLVLFLLSFINIPELTLSVEKPSIKNVSLFNFYKITYYESEVGLIYTAEILAAIITYLYLIFLLIKYSKTGNNKNVIIIIISQVVYFAGIINDSLVSAGLVISVYLSEYSFLFIILAMEYVLLRRFVNLHTAVEELNQNLERKVKERTYEINKLNKKLKHYADHDHLTNIYNRRFFNKYFDIEIKRAKNLFTYGSHVSAYTVNMNFGLAIIDIDDFKRINDNYGHLVGDKVLVEIVNLIKKHIFSRDILCRYGGEEFIILFTNTSPEGIHMAIEKIHKEIGNHKFYFDEDNQENHVTISVGLVIFDQVSNKKNKQILKIADDRLLIAKKTGKNKIVYKD